MLKFQDYFYYCMLLSQDLSYVIGSKITLPLCDVLQLNVSVSVSVTLLIPFELSCMCDPGRQSFSSVLLPLSSNFSSRITTHSFNGMLGNYVFEKVNKFYKISFIYLLPFCFVSVSDFSFVVINL